MKPFAQQPSNLNFSKRFWVFLPGLLSSMIKIRDKNIIVSFIVFFTDRQIVVFFFRIEGIVVFASFRKMRHSFWKADHQNSSQKNKRIYGLFQSFQKKIALSSTQFSSDFSKCHSAKLSLNFPELSKFNSNIFLTKICHFS